MGLSHLPRHAVVVYESMFGDTAAVAEAVARGLQDEAVDVECREVSGLDPAEPLDADLLVVGAPTHRFSLSSPGTREDALRQGAPPGHTAMGMREWLTAVVPLRSGQVVATFDTRLALLARIPVAAASAEARLAARRGFRVVGEPEGFLVEGTTGPIAPGEIRRAETWGRSLAGAIG
jgi:hypothetical protein